jgi:hypothetical protein
MKALCVFRDWGREHGLATINRSAWQCEDSRQSPCLSRERTAMTGSNGPLARLVPALALETTRKGITLGASTYSSERAGCGSGPRSGWPRSAVTWRRPRPSAGQCLRPSLRLTSNAVSVSFCCCCSRILREYAARGYWYRLLCMCCMCMYCHGAAICVCGDVNRNIYTLVHACGRVHDLEMIVLCVA